MSAQTSLLRVGWVSVARPGISDSGSSDKNSLARKRTRHLRQSSHETRLIFFICCLASSLHSKAGGFRGTGEQPIWLLSHTDTQLHLPRSHMWVAPVPSLTSVHLFQAQRRSRAEWNSAASTAPVFLRGESQSSVLQPSAGWGPARGRCLTIPAPA